MIETYSAEAEHASALVMRELAKFRSLELALPAMGRGRLSALIGQELSLGYSAIMAMMSIIEDFAVTALRIRIDDALSDGTMLMSDGRAELIRKVEGSWPERNRAVKQWFDPGLDGFAPLDEVQIFVQARNSIAHGLGTLTQRQRKQDDGRKMRAQFRSVNIGESGGRLLVGEPAVERCASCCRQTIIAWDEVARRSDLRFAP